MSDKLRLEIITHIDSDSGMVYSVIQPKSLPLPVPRFFYGRRDNDDQLLVTDFICNFSIAPLDTLPQEFAEIFNLQEKQYKHKLLPCGGVISCPGCQQHLTNFYNYLYGDKEQ